MRCPFVSIFPSITEVAVFSYWELHGIFLELEVAVPYLSKVLMDLVLVKGLSH